MGLYDYPEGFGDFRRDVWGLELPETRRTA